MNELKQLEEVVAAQLSKMESSLYRMNEEISDLNMLVKHISKMLDLKPIDQIKEDIQEFKDFCAREDIKKIHQYMLNFRSQFSGMCQAVIDSVNQDPNSICPEV